MASSNPTTSLPTQSPDLAIPPVNPSAPRPSTAAERTRRQAGLFFGGAAFALLSGLITRRSMARRFRQIAESASIPASAPGASQTGSTVLSKGAPKSSEAPGYSPASKEIPSSSGNAAESKASPPGANEIDTAAELQNSGPGIAIEALYLATVNVFSWAVMATGGLMWAFDVGNIEDLRRKVRGGMGVDGTGRTEQEAQEEVEEWIVDVLARKEKKELIRERVARSMEQESQSNN